jgi:hypothetical protein
MPGPIALAAERGEAEATLNQTIGRYNEAVATVEAVAGLLSDRRTTKSTVKIIKIKI